MNEAWTERSVFVDTNVLFYSVDATAAAKHARAVAVMEAIWRARTGRVSTQVLCEWIVNLRRKLALDGPSLRRIVEPYLSWPVVEIEPADPLDALRIADAHRLSFWDALIVRGAQKARAEILLTEDLSAGQSIEGVLVVSPF
ncbi:MAG: PIN domain-containing protein [Deltaproteobacteria bacterium]|nr:PIN domain-containing protein [Deltaproteobacteria bacterium]